MANNKIYSLLGLAQRGGNLVSGGFMVENSIKDGNARLVLVAVDASANTRKEFSDFEINCVNWVKEVKEHPELDMMEFAATIADVKNGTTSDI